MSFIKKVLGITELENKVDKSLKNMEGNLKTSWNWINYLHEMEQDNKQKIKKLLDENKELKELIKEKNSVLVPEQIIQKEASKIMQKPMQSEIKAINSSEELILEEPNEDSAELSEPISENEPIQKEKLTFKNIDISGLGKKEAYILQILYQMACFDASSSIETPKIFENLPYTITIRGLRKKMYKLQEQGVVNSVMVGNSRRWFLDMNKLSKLKEFLASRA
ncbi:MAG: hypothetical protein PHN56_00545 [Candidatus Nanoarchaeia archaeon]|nr:hypothetical protein [Candidatus Nanoarchaeia archaeon]